jgi:peroxiredoxin
LFLKQSIIFLTYLNEKALSFYIIPLSKEKLLQMKNVIALALLLVSITVKAQVKVGQAAPEISLPDTKGNIINLSSLKGKVVLIDFWASWCGPCRRATPHVVKLYQKYKDRGFEVFGVSIDSKKTDWLKAIKQDKIQYTQVNDNTGWSASSTLKYGVDGIPATFLLNKEGTIMAIDLEGKKLEEKIAGLLQEGL